MVEFAPKPWKPLPAPKLVDDLERNDRLATSVLWEVETAGPEDVVVDRNGTVYTGTADGLVLALDAPGMTREIADVGGRPLGIEWYGEDLLVCNADLGLQLVAMSGVMRTLVDDYEGIPFRFTNNATVAGDGTIYFTDTSTRRGIADYVDDLLEGQETGRLFRLDPFGELTLMLDGLQFANGVALDPDEASIFVAETGRYRVHRHWLTGAQAGETHLFIDNLPGFPDNLTFAEGTLWVSLASPRQGIVDLIVPRGWMRSLSYRMPEAVKPKPTRHGIVLGYDLDGHVAHNLQDASGRVAITTSARYHDGRLFIGSLTEPHVAVFTLP
jgi:sugar lactone lactonase YvrE